MDSVLNLQKNRKKNGKQGGFGWGWNGVKAIQQDCYLGLKKDKIFIFFNEIKLKDFGKPTSSSLMIMQNKRMKMGSSAALPGH